MELKEEHVRLTPIYGHQRKACTIMPCLVGIVRLYQKLNRYSYEGFTITTHVSTHGLSRDIGCCIYCGSKGPGLTKEHVIPAGLNGNVTLLKASCLGCADITKRFENHMLHEGVSA
jgi:hypothetical protein